MNTSSAIEGDFPRVWASSPIVLWQSSDTLSLTLNELRVLITHSLNSSCVWKTLWTAVEFYQKRMHYQIKTFIISSFFVAGYVIHSEVGHPPHHVSSHSVVLSSRFYGPASFERKPNRCSRCGLSQLALHDHMTELNASENEKFERQLSQERTAARKAIAQAKAKESSESATRA